MQYSVLLILLLLFQAPILRATEFQLKNCPDLLALAKSNNIDLAELLTIQIRDLAFQKKARDLVFGEVAGSFYEIGAGLGTYKIFADAGGSRRIVIDARSQYAMAKSDQVFGPNIIDGKRIYLSEARLKEM